MMLEYSIIYNLKNEKWIENYLITNTVIVNDVLVEYSFTKLHV